MSLAFDRRYLSQSASRMNSHADPDTFFIQKLEEKGGRFIPLPAPNVCFWPIVAWHDRPVWVVWLPSAGGRCRPSTKSSGSQSGRRLIRTGSYGTQPSTRG